MRQTNIVEGGRHAFAAFMSWHMPVDQSHVDVLCNIQVIDQVEALEHEPDAGAAMDGQLFL
jgi:hypothetical protein